MPIGSAVKHVNLVAHLRPLLMLPKQATKITNKGKKKRHKRKGQREGRSDFAFILSSRKTRQKYYFKADFLEPALSYFVIPFEDEPVHDKI